MPDCPSEILKRVHSYYPTIDVVWDSSGGKWDIIENYFDGVIRKDRKIMSYENCDGTSLPLSSDHLMELLWLSDTRKWPLPERLRLMREDKKRSEEAGMARLKEQIADHVIDNAPYFTTANRFFMDPKSMPEWKSSHIPSQAKVLKRWGVI